MKWEFDDDAALKLSALATLGYGVHAVINPSHMQVKS